MLGVVWVLVGVLSVSGEKPVHDLAQTLLARELATNPEKFDPLKPYDTGLPRARDTKPMSPAMLHTLGGLADAASTYAFLKRGTGVEGNPALGFTKNKPAATGAAAVAGLGLTKLATTLLRRKFPKAADALAANLGAEQLALSVGNMNDGHNGMSFERYGDAMDRFTTNRSTQ